MSKATKRKHVLREVNKMNDYFAPPTETQTIVRILASRGNNLHEVEDANKQVYLVSMPTKFRKNIWVKRGDYVIVEPIKEGDKVKAEMVRVLAKEHIKYFNKINVWPEGFEIFFDGVGFQSCHSTSSTSTSSSSGSEEWSTDSENDSDVIVTGEDSEDEHQADDAPPAVVNSPAAATGDQRTPPSEDICLDKIKIAPDDSKK